MKKLNKKGFTIVELVIVIAVIAILAAVLIPTFSGAIQSANESARDANAKALYTQYMTDMATAKKDPALDLKIYTDKYVYTVTNGNLDLDDEVASENAPAASATECVKATGTNGVYVVFAAHDFDDPATDAVDTDLTECKNCEADNPAN